MGIEADIMRRDQLPEAFHLKPRSAPRPGARMENGATTVSRLVKRAVAGVLSFLFLALPGLASGESYLEGFAGAAFTDEKNLDTKLKLSGLPVSVVDGTFKSVDFNTSPVFGGKVGYFFDHPFLGGNFGLELEAYHSEPDVASQNVTFTGQALGAPAEFKTTVQKADIDVTTVAFNLLYRLELYQSDNFPHGRFQPYAGIGFGLFIATLSTTTTPFDTNKRIDDTNVQPGGQALAGARLFLTPHIALFAEYKFVQTAQFTFRFRESGTVGGAPTTETARDQSDLTQHLVLTGIGFHW
jgi:opacity protein-like surface antigen